MDDSGSIWVRMGGSSSIWVIMRGGGSKGWQERVTSTFDHFLRWLFLSSNKHKVHCISIRYWKKNYTLDEISPRANLTQKYLRYTHGRFAPHEKFEIAKEKKKSSPIDFRFPHKQKPNKKVTLTFDQKRIWLLQLKMWDQIEIEI